MANPFVHLDLAADDIPAAKAFYGSVFDWKFIDMPNMNWTGIDVGPKGVGGGIGTKQMPGQPTAWTAYVEVADVKATIAKAEQAGATIIVPFMPIGEMGEIGIFIDPQGASIGVWHSTAKPVAKKAAKQKAAKKKVAKKAPKKKVAKKVAKKAAKKAPKKAPKKAAKKKVAKKAPKKR